MVAVRLGPDDPTIWCKLEFLNPSGSSKDRIARHIIDKAWRMGIINADSIVAEASSGSTSIAFALACAQMGISFVAFMPQGVSTERIKMIQAFGAEVRLTPPQNGHPREHRGNLAVGPSRSSGVFAETIRESRQCRGAPNPHGLRNSRSGARQQSRCHRLGSGNRGHIGRDLSRAFRRRVSSCSRVGKADPLQFVDGSGMLQL